MRFDTSSVSFDLFIFRAVPLFEGLCVIILLKNLAVSVSSTNIPVPFLSPWELISVLWANKTDPFKKDR